jgi:hypothetical protein
MAKLPDDLPFDRWVEYAFDHPVLTPPWYRREPRDDWNEWADPVRTAAHLRRLFEGLPDPLARWSDPQIGEGLRFLTWREASDHVLATLDPRVPLAQRVATIESMALVFERLFLPRCAPVLTSKDEQPSGWLNRVCWMWWDFLPILGWDHYADADRIFEACLSTMARVLELDSVPCQESALHGLGHWHPYHPERVDRIVSSWLAAHPDVRADLREFALQARDSQVI